MKLILSRKGFDSQNGKVASPIFPDGSMVSLPIPSGDREPARFSDIAFGGTNLGEIAAALTGRPIFRFAHAHHDPDLDAAASPRLPGWRPAIGQVNAAQVIAHGAGEMGCAGSGNMSQRQDGDTAALPPERR